MAAPVARAELERTAVSAAALMTAANAAKETPTAWAAWTAWAAIERTAALQQH